MPGFLLHFGATVQCSHAGQATPASPNPRVLVSGVGAHLKLTSSAQLDCAVR